MIWMLLGFGCHSPIEDSSVEEKTSYQAGMRDLHFMDARGKDLLMTVWYPTLVTDNRPADAYEPFTIALEAYKASAPAVTQAPLVAFSHGFFAIRYQSAFLMEHLAQQGYVVVAVDHPFNTLYDFDDSMTAQVLLQRPDDLRAAVDQLIEMAADEDDPFFQLIDDTQYAVMGHSFGSHTAMVLGGGTLNYEGLQDYCVDFPDERACDYASEIDNIDVTQYGGADDRVMATIPMSPGLWYTFGANAEGLSTVRDPLVIAGVQDDVLEYPTEATPVFQALPMPKYMIEMNQVGHYGMTNICDIAAFLSEECIEGDWQPVEEVQAATELFVQQYLDAVFDDEDVAFEHSYERWVRVLTEDD